MKKIIEVVEYFSQIANAVSKGLKTVLDNWPGVSPFDSKPKEGGNGSEG